MPTTLPSSNIYWMKFRSDNDGVGRGFKLEYNYGKTKQNKIPPFISNWFETLIFLFFYFFIKISVKLIEQSGINGVITSPLYPSFIYSSNVPYSYRIIVEIGHIIMLSIDNCILKRESSIQIHDGYDANSPLKTIEADSIPDEPITSTTNTMFLIFEINTFSESKFKLIWNQISKTESKDNITKNSLNCTTNSVIEVNTIDILRLMSPGYPDGYDTGLKCMWTFVPAILGYHVSILFRTVDLEVTPNCIADFVRVSSTSNLVTFDKNPNLCSVSYGHFSTIVHGKPILRVEFESDYYNNRTGFEADVFLECGGMLEGTQGVITENMTSPVNRRIRSSGNCEWTVNVRLGRTIQFSFDTLKLGKNKDGICDSYLIIRNGANEESPFLGTGKFCGDQIVTIPKTSSNKAYVQYVHGPFVTEKRFILKYQQIEHDCGGAIILDDNSNERIITTPNYPNIPSPHIECIWSVIASNYDLLKIEFIERFDLTTTPNCVSEYIEVREGGTSNAPLIGTFCDKLPVPIFTKTNMARLHYFTDVAVPKNGFKIKLSLRKCGKSIDAINGYISSPGFPGLGAYPSNTVCEYHINGKSGSVLNITFLDLGLPEATNCADTDHIIISTVERDENEATTYSDLMTICGSTIPSPIITDGSKVQIKFVTLGHQSSARGFRLFFNSSANICGGLIEAESGIINSPGYPISRDAPRVCEWLITVPKGRRIKIEFTDYDMKEFVATPPSIRPIFGSQQRLAFYNDFLHTSRIRRIDNINDTVEPLYSTDNKMLIHLATRSNFGHRGFKLRFSSNEPTLCAGDMDKNDGEFETPKNLTTFSCEYGRSNGLPLVANNTNDATGTLSVKITDQIVYNNDNQCYVNLPLGIMINYQERENRYLYNRCKPLDNIASPYSNTKIWVRSSVFRNASFRFNYKIHNCGGILSPSVSLNITQSIMPANYGELDCAWYYNSGNDQKIQLLISNSQFNCDNEYINVYNGMAPNRPRVVHVCGDATENRALIINGNKLFIEYHTNSYNASSKYHIQITNSEGICGGLLEAPNFVLSSPMNGTKYPSNTECTWIIKAQNGFHIGLTFTNRFMIENSVNCSKDYLEVFDKNGESWISLGRYCGRDIPPFRNSTGGSMKVVFHTDNEIDGDGFSATWSENCGGIFKATSETKIITSPRYPLKYVKNAHCNYTIMADADAQISVKFLDFELEDTTRTCVYDNVTIYRRMMYTYPPQMEEVGSYCWKDSLTSFRYPGVVTVLFQTDSWIEKRGFKFEYNTDKCGGAITSSTEISSNTDETYLSDATCIWNITAPANQNVVIRFKELDIEHNQGCYLDFVEVFEGHTIQSSHRKARVCGNHTEMPPIINVQSNKATVYFKSDSTVNAKGFKALILFQNNCDQTINLNSTNPTFELNKLTNQYESMLDCHYLIRAPPGYVIQLKFNQLHLAPCGTTMVNNSCTCDFLEVRDGAGSFAEPIGTFCGHRTPIDLVSSRSTLWIRFATG